MSLAVAVAGASGYAGGELLRLLAAHPEFEVRTITAHQNAGAPLSTVHPHLRDYRDLVFKPTTTDSLEHHDIVFLALPHGHSGELGESLDSIPLIVDCGADHRLADARAWDRFYGGAFHSPWTYGLPELALSNGGTQRANIVGATRIAVPGCNVTAVTLGLAPGIRSGVIMADDVVAVLAVGTSGAGKSAKPELSASETIGSARAYSVGGIHRHTPEIVQNLDRAGGRNVSVSLTPVLVPMSRGILATSTARLAPGVTATEVRASWEQSYASEPFVELLPEGSLPRTSDVVGSNMALLSLAVDEASGRVVTIAAVDNLVKGTAGAAIQSANVALGLAENAGLSMNGVAP